MNDFYLRIVLIGTIIFYGIMVCLLSFMSIQMYNIAYAISMEKQASIYEEINESYMQAQANADSIGIKRMKDLKGIIPIDKDRVCYGGYVYYKNGTLYLVKHENEKEWKPANPLTCSEQSE